ncbi:hypothetical protein Bca52824_091749 [Brassica carinata]|uniref:Cytochrome P450 n=1 Tax=Brassica carinata TaxID=52824 RepID=A0A8X7NUZ6_BRACI|nr:hypothetical protein Bca52824_091749 [Brassica carinata]
MEMMLISVCLAIFLAFLFLKPLFTKTTTTKLNLPPSPLHPHRSLHSLSLRYGPLMLLHFGCVPALVVSSADVVYDAMKTHDLKFSNRPKTKTVEKLIIGTEIAFSPYGEYWRQMKSICVMNLLTNKTIRSFEDIRAEEINVLMGKLEKASSSSSPVNLSKLFINLSNDVITRVVLGKKYSTEGGEYISQNVVRKFMELVATTTFALLEWTMTVQTPRQLSEDVKVHGYDIAAGTQVLINIWAIQRDVSAWGQDAEELRPGRHLDTVVDFQGQNLKFIPFGSGEGNVLEVDM